MENRNVCISFPAKGGQLDDIVVFEDPEAAWQDYASKSILHQLDRNSFIDAMLDSEVIEEHGQTWYMDTLITAR